MALRTFLPLLSVLTALTALPLAAQPGAYELLAEVRQAYAGLGSYRDLGEIDRVVDPGAGDAAQRTTMWFETAAAGDALRFDLWIEGEEEASQQVLWSDGREAFHYDGLRRQTKPVASLAAALAHLLGAGGLEALTVPLLLAGSATALREPEAAAVAGPEDCDRHRHNDRHSDRRRCWVLSLSWMAGTRATRLWIDRESFLVRRLEVEIEGAAEGFKGSSGGRPERFRVEHGIEADREPVAAERLTFRPPAAARRVAEWTADLPPGAAKGLAETPEIGFYDEITVALHTFTARIVDRRGDPLAGLTPEDLAIRVGGHRVPVTALDWVSSRPPEPENGTAAAPADAGDSLGPRGAGPRPRLPAETAGQRVVLFVQADFEPTVARGHLRLLPAIEELVAELPAEDQVAVAAFYRHLELWHDFTRDRQAIVEAMQRAVRPGARSLLRRSESGALAAHFDFRAAQKATSPERALELVAEAMAPLAGEKVVIYLGWSWGRFRMGQGVSMAPDYFPALRALDAARATVFVLDVTEADQHALEVGLQQVAADTGGTYTRTFRFTAQAAHRLARTLAGHYLVTLDRSGVPQARGRLQVELVGRQGTVLHKPMLLR